MVLPLSMCGCCTYSLPFLSLSFGLVFYFQCCGLGITRHAPQANTTAMALPPNVGTCHNRNAPAEYKFIHFTQCQKSTVTTNRHPFISNSALPPLVYTRRTRHPWRIMRNPEFGHLWAARFILSRMESVNENRRQIQNAGLDRNSIIRLTLFDWVCVTIFHLYS